MSDRASRGDWGGAAVRTAAERTLATGTARLDSFASFDGPSPGDGTFMGEGVADFDRRRARFTHRFLTESMLSRKRQQYPSKRRAVALMQAMSEPFDTFYDGDAKYVRVAAYDENWRGPVDGDSSGPRSSSDPTWRLCALLGANDDVAPAAASTIRGVETTGLALTVNLAKANALVPGGLAVHRARSRFGRRREGAWWLRVPALAWIDGEGHVRRVSVAHLARPTKPRTATSWFGTDFWDFGEPPPLEIPALGLTESGPRTDDA